MLPVLIPAHLLAEYGSVEVPRGRAGRGECPRHVALDHGAALRHLRGREWTRGMSHESELSHGSAEEAMHFWQCIFVSSMGHVMDDGKSMINMRYMEVWM